MPASQQADWPPLDSVLTQGCLGRRGLADSPQSAAHGHKALLATARVAFCALPSRLPRYRSLTPVPRRPPAPSHPVCLTSVKLALPPSHQAPYKKPRASGGPLPSLVTSSDVAPTSAARTLATCSACPWLEPPAPSGRHQPVLVSQSPLMAGKTGWLPPYSMMPLTSSSAPPSTPKGEQESLAARSPHADAGVGRPAQSWAPAEPTLPHLPGAHIPVILTPGISLASSSPSLASATPLAALGTHRCRASGAAAQLLSAPLHPAAGQCRVIHHPGQPGRETVLCTGASC